MDSLSEGVGSSQVVPYVCRLAARGLDVTLHSFEKDDWRPSLRDRLEAAGVRWHPHRFLSGGALAGLERVALGAALVAPAELVHARSDLAAASCLLARPRAWIWDMRAFWREERIELGLLRPGSPEERVMRGVEARAARSSTAIVTLSQAAVDELHQRHGDGVAAKCHVITTCADLDRFPLTPLPEHAPIRFLLAGTLNELYDVPAMVRLVEAVRTRRAAELTVLTPGSTSWEPHLRAAGATLGSAGAAEMPAHIARHHVGLSLRRLDAGITGRAATPTKLGEFLACGRPVAVSGGLGDMDALLARHRCGVIVDDLSDVGIARSADHLIRLLDDPATPARCRTLAEEHFDLDTGVERLVSAYEAALTRASGRRGRRRRSRR